MYSVKRRWPLAQLSNMEVLLVLRSTTTKLVQQNSFDCVLTSPVWSAQNSVV